MQQDGWNCETGIGRSQRLHRTFQLFHHRLPLRGGRPALASIGRERDESGCGQMGLLAVGRHTRSKRVLDTADQQAERVRAGQGIRCHRRIVVAAGGHRT